MANQSPTDPLRDDVPPALDLRQLINNLAVIHTVLLVARLGIADLLANGPRTVDDLARDTDTHPGALYRVLRALASRGMFHEAPDGRFSLTAAAAPLRRDHPESVYAWAVFSGSVENLRTWANLEHSVRTGQPAFEQEYGTAWFDYLDDQPGLATIFNDLMTENTRGDSAAIVAAHDFTGYRTIVDVGGGHGALLATILAQCPAATGILFDAPQVITSAAGPLDRYVTEGRASMVAGNFFESVPPDGDAYILKFIVHDWDDAHAITLLRNCRQAMTDGGRVLLVEMVVPPGNVPSPAKWLDLTMLLYFHSRERTEAEYRAVLGHAGLDLVSVTPTASRFSILEAVRV